MGGYLVGILTAYLWNVLPPMAVPTAVLFIAFVIGLIRVVGDAVHESTDRAGWPAVVGAGTGMATLLIWQAWVVQTGPDSIFTYITLFNGLLMAGLLALAIQFGPTARRRIRAVEAACQVLKAEIAERHRLEDQLRRQEAVLHAAMNSTEARQPGQERIRVAHEPRVAHPAERHSGLHPGVGDGGVDGPPARKAHLYPAGLSCGAGGICSI
jgi:hypothetical protein